MNGNLNVLFFMAQRYGLVNNNFISEDHNKYNLYKDKSPKMVIGVVIRCSNGVRVRLVYARKSFESRT